MGVNIHVLKKILKELSSSLNQNKVKSFMQGSAFLALVFLIVGCNLNDKTNSVDSVDFHVSPEPNADYFQEIGQDIGLDFVHSIGSSAMENIIESVGGGA
ncbi:hypothetical protein, partial [Lutimonas sp.]|uniref:hypothetical protein n=1 Tax=Lutimonas sp. TaxID=1872403 RepID=UPI003C794D88